MERFLGCVIWLICTADPHCTLDGLLEARAIFMIMQDASSGLCGLDDLHGTC